MQQKRIAATKPRAPLSAFRSFDFIEGRRKSRDAASAGEPTAKSVCGTAPLPAADGAGGPHGHGSVCARAFLRGGGLL